MNDLNSFISEGNVEIYLSGLYKSWDADERDALLRLVIQEESRMGERLEHVREAERRILDCQQRVQRQRVLVDGREDAADMSRALFLLDIFEKILEALQEHHRHLLSRLENNRL